MDMSVRHFLQVNDVVEGLIDDGSAEGERRVALRDCLVVNYDRLHRRLARYLGCADQASDCLHDAWLRLGETTIPATVQNPQAYVYRVACNVAIDSLRSNRAWQYVEHAGATGDGLDAIADPSHGPERIAEARSDVAAVDRALQRLPRCHQGVLVALRIDELTRHEVADYYGLSLRRVDTMLRQALDYCAGQTGQPATAGVRSARRALPGAGVQAITETSCR